jgi:hypothetical protein
MNELVMLLEPSCCGLSHVYALDSRFRFELFVVSGRLIGEIPPKLFILLISVL